MRDYHIHTSLCGHAEGTVVDYVEAAVERGLTEICFAEHIPLPGDFDAAHRMKIENLDDYFNDIERCRGKYRDITILTGIEADYIEAYEDYLESFLRKYPFDLVIMSIHFVSSWGGGDWVFEFRYTPENLVDKYREYFAVMLKGIQTGLFDIVGHFDIVKRPGFPVLKTNRDDVERVLGAVKAAGMSLELNTSGLRKPIDQTYPVIPIVKRAVEAGIPIVLSSDAHQPWQVGYQFDELFNRLFTFPGLQMAQYRQRELIPQVLSQPEC